MHQRIPFAALSDRQWDALRPYVEKDRAAGRPMDLRQRMNAIFFLVSTDEPWKALPAEYGPWATTARHYRRLTHAGVWENLLQALHDLGPKHPLQQIHRLIFRAVRRAYRIRGLGIIVLARRLRFFGALPGPAWMLPDPDLSQRLVAWISHHRQNLGRFVRDWGRVLRTLHDLAGGRARISRRLQVMMR